MTIIQNVACIQATINPSDKRISLNKDILRGKKILSLYMFSCTDPNRLDLPDQPGGLAINDDIDSLNLYLNLIDNKGNQFIKDLSFKNLSITTESPTSITHIKYNIDRVLDLDQSYISYKGELNYEIQILIYVFYQTINFSRFSDEISESISFNVPVTSEIQDICLHDIVNYTLLHKKIKQIIVSGTALGYFDLTTNQGKIENMPAVLFQIHSNQEIRLDNLEIDFEKSFYKKRSDEHLTPFTITFIY